MMQLHSVFITGEVVYNKVMESKLKKSYKSIEETGGGEIARARRKRLLVTLYHERYLTRNGLVWRVEGGLGKGCFGKVIPRLTFLVDMWFVKKAFKTSGYELACSWGKERRGYYLRGEGELSQELYKKIKGAVDEIDPKQVAVTRRLTPAQRVQQGCSITDLAHSVVRYRQGINKKT